MTVHSRPRVSLAELLPYAAQTTPEAIALITDEGSFTYSELDEKSNAVASALLDLGLERGQVVSLFGQNSMRWLTTYHGILKAGGVVNPINVMLSGPELSFVLSDCAAVGLFIGAAEAERIRSHLSQTGLEFMVTLDADWDRLVDEASNFEIPEVDRGPTELGSIGYTSGTTGHPKGAMQSLQSVLLNCAYTATMHGKVASDIVFSALPLAHVYGNVAVNGTLLAGGTVVLKERFDAVDVLKTIEAEKITVVEGVPAMYAMMLARHEVESTDFRSLRVSTVGGQTFSPIVDREMGVSDSRTASRIMGYDRSLGPGHNAFGVCTVSSGIHRRVSADHGSGNRAHGRLSLDSAERRARGTRRSWTAGHARLLR